MPGRGSEREIDKVTDQEFVGMHWQRAEACPHPKDGSFGISLGGHNFTRKIVEVTIRSYDEIETLAWAAAAEFTRKRVNQIKQLDEEISTIRVDLGFANTDHARRIYSSVLARLGAVEQDLKHGMKQVAA